MVIQWIINLAQSAPEIPSVLPGALSTLGVGGILGWYVYYDQTSAKPRDREENRRLMKELQEAHLKQIDEITKDSHETIRILKQECREEKEALLEELKAERAARRDDNTSMMECLNRFRESINSMLSQSSKVGNRKGDVSS